MWDMYGANRYRTVDGEYHDIPLPQGLPQIDVFSENREGKTSSIELPSAPFKDTPGENSEKPTGPFKDIPV